MLFLLTCLDMTEAVTDYLEDKLSWWDRIRFQMHLGMCWRCRAYLHQMREVIRSLGKLPPVEPPPEVQAELLHRFRDWKRSAD